MSDQFLQRYQSLAENGEFSLDPAAIAQRRLKNVCLSYLGAAATQEGFDLCARQIDQSNNMTDTLAALAVLVHADAPQSSVYLDRFYQRWQDDPLVLDKWFALQASKPSDDALELVRRLMQHPAFSLRNPNKVRSLIGTFAHRNRLRFHAVDGSGYAFLADQVLELDALNPQVTSRLASAFNPWRRYDSHRQALIGAQLERLKAHEGLSGDVFEIVSKALSG